MLLLNGISGFGIYDLPDVDSIQFKRLCYALVNYTNGKVLSFEEPKLTRNFYKAELDLNNETIFILLNTSYSYIAFASSIEYFNIKVIDHSLSSIVNTFNFGFKVLFAHELNERLQLDERTLTVSIENSLNKAELDQIYYWKPETVGNVIFNFWD